MCKTLYGLPYLRHYEIYEDTYKYRIWDGYASYRAEDWNDVLLEKGNGYECWNAFEINGVPIFADYIISTYSQNLFVWFPTEPFKDLDANDLDKLFQLYGLYERVDPDEKGVQVVNNIKDKILNGENIKLLKTLEGFSRLDICVGFGYRGADWDLDNIKGYTYKINAYRPRELNRYNKNFEKAFNEASDKVDELKEQYKWSNSLTAWNMYFMAMRNILTRDEFKELLIKNFTECIDGKEEDDLDKMLAVTKAAAMRICPESILKHKK